MREQTDNTLTVHWSKDFVEHLRTVHFTLIAVCVGLLVILSKVNTPALSQIRQIVQLQREWPPEWLYYAGTNLHNDKNLLLRLKSSLGLRGPALRRKDLKEIVGYVQAPKHNEVLRFTLPEKNWSPDKFLSSFPPTLLGFRKWWDQLQVSDRIYFPYGLCRAGDLYQLKKGESSWKPVGPVFFASGSVEQAKIANPASDSEPWRLDLQVGVAPVTYETLLPGRRQQDIVDQQWNYVAYNKAQNRRFEVSVCMLNRVDLDQEVLIRGLRDHNDLSLPSLSPGPYEKTFRALSEEARGLEVEDLSDVEKIIAERLNRGSEEFEAFGMKFPTGQITTWGTLTLIGVQLYFFLYLRRFSKKLSPGDPGWDVPWICLDQSFLAQAILLVTVVVLPFVAALILGIRASLRVTAAYWSPDSWHLIAGVTQWEGMVLLQIALSLLASLTVLLLGILSWRSRPQLETGSKQQCPAQLFE